MIDLVVYTHFWVYVFSSFLFTHFLLYNLYFPLCAWQNIYLLGTSGGLGIVGLYEGGEGLVGLGLGADVASKSVGGGLAGEEAGDGIDVANVDLDGSVVAGSEQTVGPAALAGDVEVDVVTVLVLHGCFVLVFGCLWCEDVRERDWGWYNVR